VIWGALRTRRHTRTSLRFAIERLQSLTGSKVWAALVPLTIFAASHDRQGTGGIFAVFVLGGLLTAFYLKYLDLLANITAHFLAELRTQRRATAGR